MLQRCKVAVVGGGIAGVSAAWALNQAGFEVELFEKCRALGGNAKTFTWRLEDGATVESPLLVCAWPTDYYHNYSQLLERLEVPTEEIPIKYFVKHPGGVFAQEQHTPFYARVDEDFRRWRRLIRFVKRANGCFLSPRQRAFRHPSLYQFSYANPLNFMPLYALMRAFGISPEFWEHVFVPVHSSTFITTKMKDLPAVVAPLVEDVVPLEHACAMTTWSVPPGVVFERMTADFADAVHTEHPVDSVRFDDDRRHPITIEAAGERYHADKLVFACDAPTALAALQPATRAERLLLSRVQYVDDADPTFSEAVVHSDPSVFPEDHRRRISNDYNTYAEIQEDGSLESTFVLSSHMPTIKGLDQNMLVTFNSKKQLQNVQARIPIPRSNHSLSFNNLAIMALLRQIQGKRGVYYCGSFTTPEGGHDLSFLSGLVVAQDLGAPYPLDPTSTPAVQDFYQLQKLMMGRVRPVG